MSDGGTLFDSLVRAWTPPAIAPQQLTQSILPGMSLITVNETNSASPSTEAAIVAKASYGRQIGRLVDAVAALIAERPAGAPADPAFEALGEVVKTVAAGKQEAAEARLAQMADDLRLLRQTAPAAFDAQRAALRELLAAPAGDQRRSSAQPKPGE